MLYIFKESFESPEYGSLCYCNWLPKCFIHTILGLFGETNTITKSQRNMKRKDFAAFNLPKYTFDVVSEVNPGLISREIQRLVVHPGCMDQIKTY